MATESSALRDCGETSPMAQRQSALRDSGGGSRAVVMGGSAAPWSVKVPIYLPDVRLIAG